jgi:hypothetical protein
VLDIAVFTDFPSRSMFMASSRLAKVVSVKFSVQPLLCTVLCETTKQVMNLNVHLDDGRPSTGIPEILETEVSIAEFLMSCHHEQIPRNSFCSTTIA